MVNNLLLAFDTDCDVKGGPIGRLHFSTVVGPVQQRLPLSAPAIQVAFLTVFAKLGDMPLHGLPALDLLRVARGAPPQVIAAVPLKPAPGIVRIDPAFHDPIR